MGKFLGTYTSRKLDPEEIENLNRPIKSNEITSVIKSFPSDRSPGLDGFTAELHQTLREELLPVLLSLFK